MTSAEPVLSFLGPLVCTKGCAWESFPWGAAGTIQRQSCCCWHRRCQGTCGKAARVPGAKAHTFPGSQHLLLPHWAPSFPARLSSVQCIPENPSQNCSLALPHPLGFPPQGRERTRRIHRPEMSRQCQGLHLHLDSEHGSEGKGSSWVRVLCPIPSSALPWHPAAQGAAPGPSSHRWDPSASPALKGLRFGK